MAPNSQGRPSRSLPLVLDSHTRLGFQSELHAFTHDQTETSWLDFASQAQFSSKRAWRVGVPSPGAAARPVFRDREVDHFRRVDARVECTTCLDECIHETKQLLIGSHL